MALLIILLLKIIFIRGSMAPILRKMYMYGKVEVNNSSNVPFDMFSSIERGLLGIPQ